jgi:hypothetical protein
MMKRLRLWGGELEYAVLARALGWPTVGTGHPQPGLNKEEQ